MKNTETVYLKCLYHLKLVSILAGHGNLSKSGEIQSIESTATTRWSVTAIIAAIISKIHVSLQAPSKKAGKKSAAQPEKKRGGVTKVAKVSRHPHEAIDVRLEM